MTRIAIFSALAAVALVSTGVSTTSVSAADISDNHRAYNSRRDYNHSYEKPAPRHIEREFDEEDAGYDRRRRHDNGWRGNHSIRHVEARASYASDYLPYHVREWRAKSSAIDAWKAKVTNLYGERFARWRMASDKQVNCEGVAGSVLCSVSARPVRAGSRWSWYRDYERR